jgi:hydroxymethylglutaryl-CoA lyase
MMSAGTSAAGVSDFPRVNIVEEAPREGMQIESMCISTRDKIELVNGLAATGLKTIVVGSFVSPKWVPQMSDVEKVIEGIEPVAGVTYRALALNSRGLERQAEYAPPLTLPQGADRHATRVHVCDVFVRRNTNRGQAEEIESWPGIVERARDENATQASISLNAAWGSNWLGLFTLDQRMQLLEDQHRLWDEAGIAVTKVWLGDPMGWNSPTVVAEQISAIRETWPAIRTFHLHLHNTRGLAMTSFYAALTALSSENTLGVDTSVGGIGGCPYCGNGRATGMIPTEDMVQLLEALGISTGVDIDALIEMSHFASRIVGRSLDGHVSRAGPLPTGDRLYPVDMPAIETLEEAQHFRYGPVAYAGAPPLGGFKTPGKSDIKWKEERR